MAEGLSTKYTIDITNLQAGLTKANREIRANETEWKQNALTMEDWESTTKGVSSRIKALDKTMDIQKGKVNALKKEQERLIKEGYDPLSPAVADVTQKLNKAQTDLMKTQAESKKYNKVLADMKEKHKDVASSADDASDGFTIMKGAIAGVVAQAFTGLVSSIGSAVSALWSLTEATQEYRTEMGKLTAVATEAGASADGVKDAWLSTASVLNDPQAVTEGINNLLTAGFTAEEEMDAITKGLEGASIRWKDTLKFEGLADSLQEWIGSDGASLTGNFAEMLERMGYNLEEVEAKTAGMTAEQRKQWAITTLQKEGLNELSDTYREQNAEMIKYNEANLKIQDSQARLAEMMLPFQATFKSAWADILESAMDVAEGVEGASDELIYNIGFMGGQVVKGIKSIISFAKPIIESLMPSVIAILEEELPAFITKGVEVVSNLLSGMGQKMPEVLTGITNLLADILLTITEEAPKFFASAGDYLGGFVDAIPQVVTTLGERLPEIINTISNGLFNAENDESLLNSAKNLLSKIIEAIPTTVENLMIELPKIINSILDAVGNAVPDLLLKAGELFDQIVDAIPSVLETLSVELPKILSTILDKFIEFAPDVLQGAWDLFKKVVEAVPKILGELVIAIGSLIVNIVAEFAGGEGDILQAGKDLFIKIVDAIKDLWSDFKEACSDLIDKFSEWISGGSDSLTEAGKDMILGIVDGIKNAWSSLKEAVVDTKDKILGWFGDLFKMHSPSKLMADEVGTNVSAGIADGMMDGQSGIKSAISDTADNVLTWFKDKLGIHSPAKLLADEVGKYVAQGIAVGMIDGEHYILDSAGNIVDDSTALLVRGYMDGLLGGQRDMTKETAEVISEVMEEGAESGATTVKNTATASAKSWSEEFGKSLTSSMKSIMDKILEGDIVHASGDFAGALVDAITSAVKAIDPTIGAIIDVLSPIITQILQGSLDVKAFTSGLLDFIDNVMTMLIENLPNIIVMTGDLIKELIIGIAENLPDWIVSIIGSIPEIIASFWEMGKAIAEGIWEGLKSVAQKIKDWWNDFISFDWIGDLWDKITGVFNSKNIADTATISAEYSRTDADTLAYLHENMPTIVPKVVVNQTNNYSQQHSRYEIYQSKLATTRAVRLATQGVSL